jgi:hypothetical protein
MTTARTARVLATLLIVIGVVRIASTYTTFSATVDEATHIGAGLQLFEYRAYQLQQVNPPLPRVIMAAGPWMIGMRFDPRGSFAEQLHSVFYSRGSYIRNVAFSRLGNLVFFVLTAAALWMWARQILGDWAAVLSVLLFTTEPIILGYSGLATHDAAATAGLAVALVAFSGWLRKPDALRAVALGVAFGFSILCKFASIPFVPAACLAIGLGRFLLDAEFRRRFPRASATLLLVPLVAFVVIWAGYGFTVGTVRDVAPWHQEFGTAGAGILRLIDPDRPLPAPDFFTGVGELLRLDRLGHRSYLFGQTSFKGWWWYFPAAIALKTTLTLLALVGLGLFVTLRTGSLQRVFLETLAAALAILGVSLPTKLDLGVRYILPLYIPLIVAATAGLLAMLTNRRIAVRTTAMLLIPLHIFLSTLPHPDYFPYFNVLASSDPSRYLIDSNLDWGQDVLRLRTVLRDRKVQSIGLSLMGPADYDALGFPAHYHLQPRTRVNGWIAVSDHSYRMGAADGGWQWLAGQSYRRVGRSIRLSYIP